LHTSVVRVPVTTFAEPFTHTSGFGGLCAVVAATLALIGVFITTRQRRIADAREEWGRRFVAAITQLSSDSARQRRLGRTLVEQLLKSTLATEDDRETAERLLEEDVVEPVEKDGTALLALLAEFDAEAGGAAHALDDVEMVEDDESEE